MNSSQLQPPPPSQLQKSSRDGEDRDADFLALRLLNKQTRIRLSPSPLNLDSLPGRGVLFAVANNAGLFAASVSKLSGENAITIGRLADLRNAFSTSISEPEVPFEPLRTLSVDAPPKFVLFASNDARLIVTLTNGSILVYDVQALLTSGESNILPTFVFQHCVGSVPQDVLPNPGDLPDLVVVIYEASPSGERRLDLLDAQKLQVVGTWTRGGTPNTVPTAVSWSPKGKLLAIGLQSGDVACYAPNDTSKVKFVVPRPPSLMSQSVISVRWLSNTDFHCIYAPSGQLTADSEQTHRVLILDSKANTVNEVKLSTPYLPLPGLRPPGAYTVVLRAWEPANFLLFVGDATSSDIGLLGCLTDPAGKELWANLSMEETSTPSVPLDQDMNETIILGLTLDLTSTEFVPHNSVSGEEITLPPPPVMYLYASDGTVVAWNILNTRGTPYPGMLRTSASASDAKIDSMETATDSQPQPQQPLSNVTQSPMAFSPSIVVTLQGQSSTPFGQGAFGQPSGFSQSSTPPSAFGQPSVFGASSSTQLASGGGFGAFASASPAKLGQPTGFGTSALEVPKTPSSPALASPMVISTSTQEESMAADNDTDSGFGGLSLGGDGPSSISDPSKTGIFGSLPQAKPTNEPSAFGGSSSSILKPATGFGAFAAQGPSTFGTPAPSDSAAPSAFGTTGFGAAKPATSSAFGQSGFGAKSAFGQSSFGQSSFGGSSFGASAPKTTPTFGSTSAPSTGGFAAFANKTASFGSPSSAPSSEQPGPDKGKEPIKSAAPTSSSQGSNMDAMSQDAIDDADGPKTPTKPTSAFGTPVTPKSTTTSPNTTPTTSPFTTSAKVTSGAFANLTSHPTGFAKFDSGFGAFGNTISSSSPFLQAQKTPPTSAFGATPPALSSTPSSPPSAQSAGKPVFGATSTFGAVAAEPKVAFGSSTPFGASAFGKPALAPSPSTPPATPSVPATGAFSSFAGNNVFSSFASGGNKSFGELLRSGKEETAPAKEPPKAPVSAFSKIGTSAPRTSVFGVPLKPSTDTSETTSSPKTPESGSSEDSTPDDDGDGEDDDDAISFVSASLSDTDSDRDSDDGEEEAQDEPSPDSNNDKGKGKARDDAADEDNSDEDNDDLVEVQLPQATSPAIKLTTSAEATSTKGKESSSVDEKSTTPPGSPDTNSPPVVVSPVPVTAPAASIPFSLGLGRPSTKPTRSSPLASAPISGDDDDGDGDDDDDTIVKPRAPPSRPGSASAVKKETSPLPSSRPKTPPILSTITPPMPKPTPFTLTPSITPPLTTTPPSIFGTAQATGSPLSAILSKPPASSSPTESVLSQFSLPKPPSTSFTPPAGGLFGQKTATPPPMSPFGLSPKPTPSAPPTLQPPAGLFGQKPASPVSPVAQASAPGSFSFAKPGTPTLASATPAVPASASNKPGTPGSNLDALEEGMQKECMNIFMTMVREFEATKTLALQLGAKKKERYKQVVATRGKADLGNHEKFALGDAVEFGRTLRTVERDLIDLRELKTQYTKAVRDLEGAMLKVTMRKEEVVRFSKAKDDADFAKMLKARSLGPEHLETQVQLRRGVRVIRDRIQKLEDHMQASKKRLSQIKLGKAGLKPPSLDTINRTYRNIDLAIAQQVDEVTSLVERVDRLNLDPAPVQPATRVGRLPANIRDSPSKRAKGITPNVAATTAAALNAERAAQRLKGALLRVRKEPMLNTQAVGSSAPPIDFLTPQKIQSLPSSLSNESFNPPASSSPLLSFSSPGDGKPQMPQWTLPPFQLATPDSLPLSTSPTLRQRERGGTTKMHQKAVPLKKSTGSDAPTGASPPGFSWGPLPGVSPMRTLSADVRKKDGPGSSSGPPLLSNSWVTEGFGTR